MTQNYYNIGGIQVKKENALKRVLVILIILLISLVSFVGIFAKKGYKFEKVLPEYIFGMDFSDRMLLSLKITNEEENNEETEQKENTEETQNTQVNMADNIKNAKKVFEKRLSILQVPEYYIRGNEKTGEVVLELPSNTESSVLQNTIVKGDFKINDGQGNTIADHNSVKDVNVDYYNSTYGTLVKFTISFKDDAIKKFNELSAAYSVPVDENGAAKEEKVSLQIDGTAIYSAETTEFYKSILGGSLQLYMGQGVTDEQELKQYYIDATCMAAIIKSGPLPETYKIDYNNLVSSDLSINAVALTGGILFVLMAAYMIYKFKINGLYGVISIIGFIASLFIVLRYTNVIIAFEGVFAIALIIAINYAWIYKFLLNISKPKANLAKVFNKTVIEFADVFIISSIIAVAFCFAGWLSIFSFGMIMFWGVILILAYNFLITETLIGTAKK